MEMVTPLTRGEVGSYDFSRMTFTFTMLDGSRVINCAVSTAAMDDMERRGDVPPRERKAQFLRLRDRIEDCAARKSIEDVVEAGDPNILLLSEDFFR